MPEARTHYRWKGEELELSLHIQPRASRDAIVGPHGDSLKVCITAPPVDGKANAHLLKFIAKQFGVPRGRVSLVSGESGRQKRLRIDTPKTLPPIAEIAPP